MMLDWARVRLAVFDVDGTLYDQMPVRRAMAATLLGSAFRRRGLRTIAILRNYRNLVDRMAGSAHAAHPAECLRRTAHMSRCSEEEVRVTVDEWMHRRPLASIRKHRAHGIAQIFDALRASGRQIAVWSDYPVDAKLDALELRADIRAWPEGGMIDRLKPDPAGLSYILDAANIAPAQTVMIGDRFDRDWTAAASLGVPALIRARRADRRAPTFWRYDDPPFAPLIDGR